MMTRVLTREFLNSIGVTLSDEEVALLSEHFETTLRQRVIAEVLELLDDEQGRELAAMTERDDPGVSDWLTANVPELTEVIQDEVAILLGELVESRESL